MNILTCLLVIVVMIILSAFFSGSEISFNASNKFRLKKSADAGNKTAKLAYNISEHFKTALSAILIGNNLANIAASTCATMIFIGLFAKIGIGEGVASVVATVVMTIIVLIFGEIVPKIVAKANADKFVIFVAYPIRVLTIILFPIVIIVMGLIRLLSKIWGTDKNEGEPTVTEDEFAQMVETVSEEGVIDDDKTELIQSTLDFKHTTVEEVMTPRINIVDICIDDDMDEIEQIISESHFSRIPVYEEDIDDIIGILYLNHYYKQAAGGKLSHDELRKILLKPCFLHKTMRLPVALDTMRKKKTHIAIVIDEFGGTLGIVTMEDILEELVGDIWDDNDDIVEEVSETSDNTFEVAGDMNIDDFFDAIGYVPDDSFECEYSTVGGWCIERLDAEPHVGDTFEYDNITVTVTEMDDMSVTKAIAKIVPKPDDDEEL